MAPATSHAPVLTAVAVIVSLLVALPVISLCWIAATSGIDSLLQLFRTVLPGAALTTSLLMAGVAVLSGMMGAMGAWLVTFFEFPGRRVFAWAMVLPLAVPTYLAAYAFVEFFSFTGPVQQFVRLVGDFQTSRDYFFPNIRSLGGAVLILSLVLYPYVYLACRALFALQGRRLVEASQLLGAGQWRIFRRILVPMARPAIALGITLALMETINDIGAVEFLGVRTLTFSVFSLWLNQGDLAGAAQLALVLLVVVFGLILIERQARRDQRYFELRSSGQGSFSLYRLRGATALIAFAACLFPIVTGFGIPAYVLGGYALHRLEGFTDPKLLEALATSLAFAAAAATVTVAAGFVLAYWARLRGRRGESPLVRLATIGYAIPGTIVALGLFIPIAAFDNAVDGFMRGSFGIATGLLLSGSGVLILYAYAIRFMAMAEGALDGGLKKLSPSLDMAARTLGRSHFQTVRQVLLPLLWPPLATGALLVFIDSLKELSATILLRPFGVNTLSTYIYEFASRARIEDASPAAFVIILAGITPVYLLSHMARRGN
ncbi:MAG: iron ABC transporter permease [Rhodobiaceae bacterium]|nr:iron ABC transporter permease [Rhodobiaceae bacterium]MCC0054913.1 iron ABC transporter permease [Rhodobiaceae bacterium]